MPRFVPSGRPVGRGPSVVAQALEGADTGRLAALLAARPDLGVPAPRDLAEVQWRAGTWHSVMDCYESLDVAAQQVLQVFPLLPAQTTTEELARLLGPDVTTAEVEPVIDRLAALALVARDREGRLRVVEAWREIMHPAGLGPPIADLMTQRRAEQLQDVARTLGVEHRGRKAEVLARLEAELSQPDRVLALLGEAPPPVLELAVRLAEGPPVAELPYYGPVRGELPITWLLARGLAVASTYDTATMPREVSLAMRGGRLFSDLRLSAPPLDLRPVDAGAVESAALEAVRTLVGRVAGLLDACDQRPAALLKNGGVGVREVRRLATALDAGETETARLIELAASAGLLGGDADGGQLLPAYASDDWRRADTAARWSALLHGWRRLPHHLSVAGAPDRNGKATPPLLPRPLEPQAVRVRRLVLGLVGDAPADRAATRQSLVERLVWSAPDSGHDGVTPGDLIDELDLLGLAWQGASSSLGRAVVAGEDPEHALTALLPPATREFVLQADLTAIASGELASEVRRELELMADLESSGAATVYRFSPASLRRAFDAGHDSAALLAFLEAHASRGVPQALAYLVGDLGRRYGRLRVRGVGCYVRSDDTALLAELTRVRAFAGLGLSLVAPTVVSAAVGEEALMAALRAEGYLPALEGAAGETRPIGHDRPRAPAGPQPRGAGWDDGALTRLAELLGQAKPAARSAQLTLVGGDLDLDDDPPPRHGLADDPEGVVELLEWAIGQDWPVSVVVGATETLLSADEIEHGWVSGVDSVSGDAFLAPVARVSSVRLLDDDEAERVFAGW